MTVGEAILAGFALAHRRLHLLLIDITWKAFWLSLTVLLCVIAALWFNSQFVVTELDRQSLASGIPPLVFAALRRLWSGNVRSLLWGAAAVAALSGVLWLVLEAYFRAGILPLSEENFLKKASANFLVFLVSGVATRVALISAGVVIFLVFGAQYLNTPLLKWPQLWPDTRGGFYTGILSFGLLAFAVTILDTLIRADSLDLVGNHLGPAAGVIAALLLFEACIVFSVLVTIVAGIERMSRFSDFVLIAIFSISSFLFLSVFHSYLLLVRYFSIGIMRDYARDI